MKSKTSFLTIIATIAIATFVVSLIAGPLATRGHGDNSPMAVPSVEIALPYFKEVLILPVTISNKEHFFVLDSGASVNTFHSDLQDCLGDPIRDRILKANTPEQVKIGVFRAPAARVGTLPVTRKTPVACMNLTKIQCATGRNIQGILGMPFFHTNIIQVDFDQRKLRIFPLSTDPIPEWGQPVDVVYTKSNLPVVRARFGDYKNEPCIVDTGFSGTLSLRSEVFSYLSQLQQLVSRSESAVATVGRFNLRVKKGLLSDFELADYLHQDLPVLCQDAGMSLVGLNYFRRYMVTFDLSRNRFFLAKGFDFDRADKSTLIGLVLLRREGKTIVEAISLGSPADVAGLSAGDELVSVAGVEIGTKPIAEIVWMFRAKMASENCFEIAIRRNGEEESLILGE